MNKYFKECGKLQTSKQVLILKIDCVNSDNYNENKTLKDLISESRFMNKAAKQIMLPILHSFNVG